MTSFAFNVRSPRVVFGRGTLAQLPDEVAALGKHRPFLVAGDRHAVELPGAVGRFTDVVQHTPVEVSDRAAERAAGGSADCVVSVGGGSATGLGKAVAARLGLPHVAVPTTYAGSEVTPVLGETAGGVKTTRRAPEILPATVVYDVDLTLGLPVPLSVTSGINALAHAVEALYAPDANPAVAALAVAAIGKLAAGLRGIVRRPDDVGARTATLEGAWLAGLCLGNVQMGLHHKLCHLLGGTYGLPHSETHTVLLPHVMALRDAELRPVADALGAPDPAAGVYDLITELGGPTSLRELGLSADDLAAAGPADVLRPAWEGSRPAGTPDFHWLTDEVVASFAKAPDPRLRELLTGLVRALHRYANDHDLRQAEWETAIDFLTRTGQISDDKRQEFVLLSDTFGVSSMVDLLTNSRTPETTPSAVLGPFYVPGPPEAAHGDDLGTGLPGTPLWVDVQVTDVDGAALGDAVVDVWQSNKDGFYDVQLKDLDGPSLRARFRSDAEGRVRFWTILPSEYPIPGDGPVGQMLAATGRHPYRAPHLHFLITAPGHKRLVTQLFVAGGAYLDSDTVFGVKDDLIVDFAPQSGPPPDGRAIDGEWRRLEYRFVLAEG
jgi:alcohol dehydrogenase class IV/protocatechuate 3,4-dioxygenase beta subunit